MALISPTAGSPAQIVSNFTPAELLAICSSPAGIAALFQLLLAGNTVDITMPAVTGPLAAMVTAGVLTQARAAAVLTPLVPAVAVL